MNIETLIHNVRENAKEQFTRELHLAIQKAKAAFLKVDEITAITAYAILVEHLATHDIARKLTEK